MKQLHQSEFSSVNFDEENQCIEQLWANVETQEEDYRQEQLAFFEGVKAHHPTKAFIDTSVFSMIVSPELQVWAGENILRPSVGLGLQKAAFVLPDDLFAEVSIQQALEENEDQAFRVMYFKDKDEAKKWLYN